jgi:hypothetical protein
MLVKDKPTLTHTALTGNDCCQYPYLLYYTLFVLLAVGLNCHPTALRVYVVLG